MSEKKYDSLSKALASLYVNLGDIKSGQEEIPIGSVDGEGTRGVAMNDSRNPSVLNEQIYTPNLNQKTIPGLTSLKNNLKVPKQSELDDTIANKVLTEQARKSLLDKEKKKPVPTLPTGGQEKNKFEPKPGQIIPDFSSREPAVTEDKPDYVSQTIKALENYNLSIDAIAGIMGNILVEAPDANPNTIEKTTKKDKGRGLFQYSTGTDKKGALPFYKTYLEENNLTDSMENQIGFAMKEIMNPRESKWLGYKQANKLKKLLKTGNVEQITKGFLKIFEKPEVEHLQRRLDNSNNIYKRLMNEQGEYIESLIKQREKIQQKQSGGMIESDPYKREPRFI